MFSDLYKRENGISPQEFYTEEDAELWIFDNYPEFLPSQPSYSSMSQNNWNTSICNFHQSNGFMKPVTGDEILDFIEDNTESEIPEDGNGWKLI